MIQNNKDGMIIINEIDLKYNYVKNLNWYFGGIQG